MGTEFHCFRVGGEMGIGRTEVGEMVIGEMRNGEKLPPLCELNFCTWREVPVSYNHLLVYTSASERTTLLTCRPAIVMSKWDRPP